MVNNVNTDKNVVIMNVVNKVKDVIAMELVVD